MYDFDTVIDRSNTDSVKIELCNSVFGTSDITPMWVADMDFPCPTPIVMTLRERIEHPIYGYTIRSARFQQCIKQWQKKRNNWDIDSKWIEWCPGVVPSLAIAINAFSNAGDGVIIQPPVYPPFFDIVKENNRALLCNHLRIVDGKWSIDYDEFEKMASMPTTKLFILCHPHNPIGRDWTIEELEKLGEICLKNNVLILSDEIHSDIMLNGTKHHPMATISAEIANNTITFMAASKTFNIAGLTTSYVIIPNNELKNKYISAQRALHLENNMLGPLALQAAYANCETWLNELCTYLSENVRIVTNFVERYIPEIQILKPDATYLLWLDFSRFNISHADLKHIIYNRIHLGINDGTTFGKEYEKCFRLNVASPQSVIEDVLEKMKKVFDEIRN